MKKILTIPLILSALLLMTALSACNTTSFEATRADGTHIKITNQRVIWTTDSYAFSLTTNGASLSANKSATDKETIEAIVQGAVAGAGQAMR